MSDPMSPEELEAFAADAPECERSPLWVLLDWSLWGAGMGDTFREPLASTMVAAVPPEVRSHAELLMAAWLKLRGVESPSRTNAELRAELAAREATVEALTERSKAYKAELDRVIREAAADKAKLAELEGSTCQACGERTVRLQTEAGGSWTHHDGVNCWNRCADNPGKVWPQAAPGTEGWRGAYMHAQTLLEEAMRRIAALEPAPEMPRPPAEEAHSGTDTLGTGSGRGTGVAEALGTAQASEGGTDG